MKTVRRSIIVLLIISSVFLFSALLYAQETPTPVDPNSLIPGYEESKRHAEAFATDIASRSVFNYRIAYLITLEAAGSETLFAPETINALTGAEVFYEWEDFEAADEEAAFDVVLLHDSAFGMVDSDWIYYAYRQRVIFVAINIHPYDFGALVGDRCVKPLQKRTPNWDHVYFPQYVIRVVDERYRSAAEEAYFKGCRSTQRVDGIQVTVDRDMVVVSVLKMEDLREIPYRILIYTQSYGKPIK